MARYLALAGLLLAACGPAPETVACCECLAENDCVEPRDPPYPEERQLEVCLMYAETDAGIKTDVTCWEPLFGGSPPCADACEARNEDLRRGSGQF